MRDFAARPASRLQIQDTAVSDSFQEKDSKNSLIYLDYTRLCFSIPFSSRLRLILFQQISLVSLLVRIKPQAATSTLPRAVKGH